MPSLCVGRPTWGSAIEFDKIELTGDLDKRNCDYIMGMGMNSREKRRRRIGCSEFRCHFQGVFK